MMAMVPLTSSGLLPLLESLEDSTAGQPEQTDAYLTIANRLSGDDGKQFLPAVVKHFSRLGKTFQTHIFSQNAELCQAALQALGFCVFHVHVVSAIPDNFAEELLSALSSLVVKSTDKNTCTRALWVISKQNFPPEVVANKVPEILRALECVRTREDIQSVLMEHESLNVVISLLEQAPAQMGEVAVQWAKLVIPLVVHSASKVRLRAAAALEMGLPLLLKKQKEVAAIVEPIMSSKLIPELQKLFSTKNETNVLKLWPLFVRLLGKLLHRGGPFINSLLGLEELGFRSSSPNIKKVAFIAWKSLIDNFALNPEILCSAKRLKLLMQPLSSIQVRTEALLLTKLEVWWYLVVKLGANLPTHFEQVGVPLLQCTLGPDSAFPATPARSSSQCSAVGTTTPKTGSAAFSSTAVPRLNLNTSVVVAQAYPSIQLLGLEMLLHYFLGPEVTTAAAKNKLTLSLEPITHPFLSSPSSFTKHASLLIAAVCDSFICIGKDAPDALLTLIWKNLVSFVSTTIDAAGHKKERQGSEVLTLLLQALQSIISSEALPAHRALSLLELTVKGIPQRVLGSASYQVGKMDVLNGTPALFLILLFYNRSLVAGIVEDERFFLCFETLVSCGLSGPTSPLAFGEAVLGVVGRSAGTLGNKEQLWRMWSVVVNPLTDTITQSNEVNQGDALEHNFSAVHTALMFPITHLLPGKVLPQMTQKSMLGTWSRLYKVFARCSALVATAEENVCCGELCVKMAAILDRKALKVPSTLDAVANILLVIAESADFSPYTPQFQQKMKSPHTPLTWVRKKSKALGNLSTFHTLLVQSLETFNALEAPETVPDGTGLALVSILSTLFSNLALATAIQEALASLTQPLAALYEQAGRTPNEQLKFTSSLGAKLEKLLGDVLGCLQTRSALAYDDELLSLLSPLLCVLFLHRRKQVRSLATQFWNATFANTLVLVYPEELKPVLSQVKQNTPILLPGFQSVEVPDELSGQYSSESSQLETKLSGVQVTPGVKRDSLLPRAGEMKDRNSKTSTKPVSTKLDFGSHKLPRREELEEQASIDFVFIPPETKERVLTEHQKEVKRTKRVDIPAMYNNLDASLDTTVFTQYTQSQEESLDKLPADEQAEDAAKDEGKSEDPEENMEMEDEASEVLAKDTQEYISPTNEPAEPAMEEEPAEEVLSDSADVSMEDANEVVPLQVSDVAMESREVGTSPNVSGGSDMISGTPQKHNSRRQSFITLEKYAEGKPASPASVVKFTGPLTRTTNSQEPASQEPEAEADTDRQDSLETKKARHKSSRNESFLKEGDEPEPSENKMESEVEILAEKRPSETTEDDVIPDTQTQVEVVNEVPVPAGEEVMVNNSQEEEESKVLLEDSPSSQSTLSQGEPRRSGRRRSRPLRPGEDAEEQDHIDKLRKKSQPGEEASQTDSPKTAPSPASQTDSQSQCRASRRSKLAVEEDGGKDKLRKRSHKEVSESSQSNSQVATPSPAGDSNSQSQGRRSNKLVRESEELVEDKRKRRGVAEEELSQSDSLTDTASDNDSQSQSRCSQRSKLAVEVEDDGSQKQRGSQAQKEKPSQTDSHVATPSQLESQSQGRASRSKAVSDSEEFDLLDKVEKQDPTEEEQSQSDSQMATPSPAAQTGYSQSQGRSSRRSKLVIESEEQGKDKQKRRVGTESTLRQIDSKITTPSATPKDSQSQGRASRKSKVPLEVAELEDKTSPNVATDSAAAPEMSQTDSQVTPSATSQTASQPRPRGRPSKRSKLEEQVKASSSPTIETESSQVADQAGTQESPQESKRTTRRRASQGLLSSNVENSESHASETREDAQKPKKRGRKPKSTEALPSPLATVGSGDPGAYQEIPMDSSESSLKSESKKSDSQNPWSEALEVKIPQDVDETIKTINSLKPEVEVLKLPLITKNDMGQREADTEMVDMEGGVVDPVVPDKAEHENTKPPSQQIDSSLKPDLEQLKSLPLCISPRKKERGHKLSESISNFDTVSSQEGDLGCEGPTRLQNKLLTDSEQANSPVSSAEGNAVSGYDSVFLEPNKLRTPPISNGLPTDTSPSEAAEEKLSLQVSESSEEKVVDVPKPVTVSSEEVTEEQMGEDKENRHPESTNNVLEDQPEEVVFMSIVQTQPEGFNALDEEQQEEQYTCIKEGQPEPDNTSTRTRENDTEPQADDVQDITPLQERAKMDTVPGLECEEEDGEETQIDNNDLDLRPLDSVAPLTFDTREAPVPLHHPSTSKDVLYQDSPPKQKGLEAMMGLEVGQSPSRIRGVWTPSASPSTSILKKGPKRPIEEESPSPFTKSRRVSFADPIQHQELADDIDRRSPIIRSSSPRAKTASSSIPQPKYITTPTKGLLILSPRNLCSPAYKSSKKCLISEMSQEPRPIPKDCVYPALVSCSTPVEAVLPQITSNMWPRGFGQLVRARNIKTVGDLSALTPSEIKNLPIRSPKISNVKTALKTYHEQQRKGRSDELKSFEEMENMTSELEESTLPQNQEEEDKTPGEGLATEMEQGPEERSDQSRPDHQRPEGDLPSEVEALGARLTGEELSHCSPDQLVQLHDQLGGMMKNVVVQLQSRLLAQNKDSGS
ncbi:telomere-associated protein RIF1 isoform X1 [Coregonus clupeaformis]|uniref:telomere-associated protein RIF1 isoform X1 n=1 Tax=Coregonus clupeaformis TaxID=59861 RepID=UPI001E1C56F5|nr:telomere-associated protein RIF1 isoform X1 [Coregonus clupeaformis]XP_041700696.2 telomere-associated protein RIF1 isoform X1 [Coregonus clupeaformis]